MNYVTPSWLSVFKSFKNFIVKINIDIFFSASIEFIQQGILLLAIRFTEPYKILQDIKSGAKL